MKNSPTPIKDRAVRFRAIARSRNRFPWDKHEGASHEFKVLDVLYDIRTLLLLILCALVILPFYI